MNNIVCMNSSRLKTTSTRTNKVTRPNKENTKVGYLTKDSQTHTCNMQYGKNNGKLMGDKSIKLSKVH